MPISSELKQQILNYIKQPIPQNDKMPIVSRSVPVPFFGDIENATVATISINPSNCEFVDKNMNLFNIFQKRFEDRDKLKVNDTDYLTDSQAKEVYDSLILYFKNKNSYTNWFDRLQKPLGNRLEESYYDGTMVNIDIFPWATEDKWNQLSKIKVSKDDKVTVTENALKAYRKSGLLKNMLLQKKFKYVYMNGSTVKNEITEYFSKIINEHFVIIDGQKYCLYEGKLDNGTKLIGLNCYIPSTPVKTETLNQLLEMLSQYM